MKTTKAVTRPLWRAYGFLSSSLQHKSLSAACRDCQLVTALSWLATPTSLTQQQGLLRCQGGCYVLARGGDDHRSRDLAFHLFLSPVADSDAWCHSSHVYKLRPNSFMRALFGFSMSHHFARSSVTACCWGQWDKTPLESRSPVGWIGGRKGGRGRHRAKGVKR